MTKLNTRTRFFLNFQYPEHVLSGTLRCYVLENGELKSIVILLSKIVVQMAKFGGPWYMFGIRMESYKEQIKREKLTLLGFLAEEFEHHYKFSVYFITPGSSYREIPLPSKDELEDLGLIKKEKS